MCQKRQLTWAACQPRAHGALGPGCQKHLQGGWNASDARTLRRMSGCQAAAQQEQLCGTRVFRKGTSRSPSAVVAAAACHMLTLSKSAILTLRHNIGS